MRFERHQRGACFLVFGQFIPFRQEYPFADDVRDRVKKLIHRMEAEVGHTYRMRVGIAECDPEGSAAFYDVAFLNAQLLFIAFYDPLAHMVKLKR